MDNNNYWQKGTTAIQPFSDAGTGIGARALHRSASFPTDAQPMYSFIPGHTHTFWKDRKNKVEMEEGDFPVKATDIVPEPGQPKNINPFRQGSSNRDDNDIIAGLLPKFSPARQFTPYGGQNSTTFGQSKAFFNGVPFEDMPGFNAVMYLNANREETIYPRIMYNVSLKDPYQMDGVIEPLEIRDQVSLSSIGMPYPAHRFWAAMVDGNEDELGGASQVVQIYDWHEPRVVKPFIDFTEGMGPARTATSGGISFPGIIAEERALLRPYHDRTFRDMIYTGMASLKSSVQAISIESSGSILFASSSWTQAIFAMTGTYDTMLRDNQQSSTAGFTYDNISRGTDSLAFGGWKK